VGSPPAGIYTGNTGSGLDYTVQHILPEFSGPILVVVTPTASCVEKYGAVARTEFFLTCVLEPDTAVCAAGFLAVPTDTTYYRLQPSSTVGHDGARYLTLGMLTNLVNVSKELVEMDGLRKPVILDASLLWGGAIDWDGDFDSIERMPGHRTGNDFDILWFRNEPRYEIHPGPLWLATVRARLESFGLSYRFHSDYDLPSVVPTHIVMHVFDPANGTGVE
jgi:hypothetical protein